MIWHLEAFAMIGCLTVAACHTLAQPSGGGGVHPACTIETHCDQLDEDNQWQPGTCMYLYSTGQLVFDYFEYDIAEYTIGMVVEHESGPYDMYIIDSQFCEVVENCSEIPEPQDIVYEYTRTTETCWEINGNVEVEVGTSLATKLIAELDVEVSIGGSWSGCKTETDQITVPYELPSCEDLRIWKEKGTADVEGSVEVTPSIAHWHAAANGNPYTSRCGTVENADGTADTVRYIRLKNQFEPCCEAPEGEICCGCIG